jgi:hypothetical protein
VSEELIAFLEARLDEDERMARAATPGPWRHDPGKHHHVMGTPLFQEAVFAGPPGADAICVAGTGESDDPQSMRDAEHIARHDPARVLREVDAKRQLVDRWEELEAQSRRERLIGDVTEEYRTLVALVLAATYSDHPDFRPEWASAS